MCLALQAKEIIPFTNFANGHIKNFPFNDAEVKNIKKKNRLQRRHQPVLR